MKPGRKRSLEGRDKDRSPLEPAHKRCKVEPFLISHLPYEMLAAVLGHLPTGDKGRAAQVCHLWCELLDNPMLWKKTHIAIDMAKMTAYFLFSLKKRQVPRLTITACSDIKKLQDLLHKMPQLEYLDLSNLKSLSHQTHLDLFHHEMPALKKLYLPCSGTQYFNVIATKMPNLVTFCAEEPECLPPVQMQVSFQILSFLPMQSLQTLYIPSVPLEDHDLVHLKVGLQNLKSLYVTLSRKASEIGMQMVAEIASLQDLYLDGESPLQDISIKPLCTGMAKIRRLLLNYVVSEANARSIATMNNLENLILMGRHNVILQCLSEGLQNLRILHFFHFLEMTASGVTALAKMVQLEYLILGHSNVNDNGLHILRKGLVKLSTLDLCSCHNFTDKGLEYVGDMPSLHTLGIFDCSIGDGGLLRLCEGTAPLACLKVGQCSWVTEMGRQALIDRRHVSIVEHPGAKIRFQL